MKRLNEMTITDFVHERDVAVIMFGAPEGEATMEQAVEFANVWADHAGEAAFGYLDAFDHVAAARANAIRVLPTTLVIRNGRTAAKFEGRCPAHRISAAIARINTPHQFAA